MHIIVSLCYVHLKQTLHRKSTMHACSVAQLCLTLCYPIDCSSPGSSVHRIFQARVLPFPTPGDLPDPGIESESLASPTLAGRFFTAAPPAKLNHYSTHIK